MHQFTIAQEQQNINENKSNSKTQQRRELYKEEWIKGKDTGKLQLLTERLDDLLDEEFPPEVWLVDQLIPDEGVTILAGLPGCFKTWLYMYIAVKVAKGEQAFGRFNTKKTGVLVIDEESGRRRLQKRFKQLGATSDTPIHFTSRIDYKMNQLYAEAIEQKARDLGVGLIVFDSFTRFNGDGDENASGDMSRLMDNYRQLANAGFAVLILHHNRKDGVGNFNAAQAMRGSIDILASVDCHIAVTRSGQSEIIKLEQTKNRDTWEQPPIKLRFQPNASEFEFVGTDKTTADKQLELQENLLELINNNPGLTQGALVTLAKAQGIKGGEKKLIATLDELDQLDKLVINPGNTPRAFSYHVAPTS